MLPILVNVYNGNMSIILGAIAQSRNLNLMVKACTQLFLFSSTLQAEIIFHRQFSILSSRTELISLMLL